MLLALSNTITHSELAGSSLKIITCCQNTKTPAGKAIAKDPAVAE